MTEETTATVSTAGHPVYEFPNEPVHVGKLLLIKKLWAGFHNSVILALIFTMLGISIGVHVSKTFYSDKLQEVITTGALLYKAKVYTINPRL